MTLRSKKKHPPIKVGGSDYKILVVPDNATHSYWGKISYTDRTIVLVDKWPNEKQFRNTFLHEIVHAISDERSLGLSEKQVTQLTNGLIAVFEDNPSIRKLL